MIKISPSMLSSNYAGMGEDAARIERAGADWLHLDIMDGTFVPPISFGADIIAALRKCCGLFFDVHLMVEHPQTQIDSFAKAGAQMITVHAEACTHLQRTVQQIKELGIQAGVALNPATPLSALDWVMEDVDLILVMTVNPGYGGQKLIPQTLRKVQKARELISATGREINLQVDGGVNGETASLLTGAGADVLVSGSYVFAAPDAAAAIRHLKGL